MPLSAKAIKKFNEESRKLRSVPNKKSVNKKDKYWPPAISWGISYHRVTWGKKAKEGPLGTNYFSKDFKNWNQALAFAKNKAKSLGFDKIQVSDERTGSYKFKPMSISQNKKLRITRKIPRLR